MTYTDFVKGKRFRFKGKEYFYCSDGDATGIYIGRPGAWTFHCHVVSVGPTGVYVSTDLMGFRFSKCLPFEKFIIIP